MKYWFKLLDLYYLFLFWFFDLFIIFWFTPENISKEILSLGGGLNILDTFSDSSWRKRVEIVNNNEMDLVIKAIKNVTRVWRHHLWIHLIVTSTDPRETEKRWQRCFARQLSKGLVVWSRDEDQQFTSQSSYKRLSCFLLWWRHIQSLQDAVFITSRLLKATNDEETTKLRRKRDLECYERQQMQSRFIEVFETIMSNVAHFLDAKSKQQGDLCVMCFMTSSNLF